jgi:O-phosphoseryl-tRNA(Cys) synthetase
VTKRDIDNLPVPKTLKGDSHIKNLAERLLDDLWKNAETRLRVRADGTRQEEVNFQVGKSKVILDEIDENLGKHYGLTDKELDFIVNYDVKFRMQNEN